jgi:hypothetical protein
MRAAAMAEQQAALADDWESQCIGAHAISKAPMHPHCKAHFEGVWPGCQHCTTVALSTVDQLLMSVFVRAYSGQCRCQDSSRGSRGEGEGSSGRACRGASS